MKKRKKNGENAVGVRRRQNIHVIGRGWGARKECIEDTVSEMGPDQWGHTGCRSTFRAEAEA